MYLLKNKKLLFLKLFRKFILLFGDPEIQIKIRGVEITINVSHNLPIYVMTQQYYDSILPRLVAQLLKLNGNLRIYDIGANIGDSILFVEGEIANSTGLIQDKSVEYHAIEGDSQYFTLFKKNMKNVQSVKLHEVILSDSISSKNLGFSGISGTSHIMENDNQQSNSTITLDSLFKESITGPDVIKIDTDGYDYKCMRGAKEVISKFKPIIYFEFSPMHLEQVGENPASIFPFLERLGYNVFVFYDHQGYFFLKLSSRDEGLIEMLINYCGIKPKFYYDIIAFPDSKNDFMESYLKNETQVYKSKSKY